MEANLKVVEFVHLRVHPVTLNVCFTDNEVFTVTVSDTTHNKVSEVNTRYCIPSNVRSETFDTENARL